MRATPKRLAAAAVALTVLGGGATLASAAAENDIRRATVGSPPAHAAAPLASRGYEVWRSNISQPDIEITTVGGLRQGTHVLTLELPAGSYFVWAWVTAGKQEGWGFLRCAVLVPEGAVTFARASMGNQPGTVSDVTLTSHGAYTVPAGGGVLELKCTQEPGSNGATPRVFDALIDVLEVGSYVSTGS